MAVILLNFRWIRWRTNSWVASRSKKFLEKRSPVPELIAQGTRCGVIRDEVSKAHNRDQMMMDTVPQRHVSWFLLFAKILETLLLVVPS